MLFARSDASSGVRNLIMLNTDPKISSDAKLKWFRYRKNRVR